MVCESEINLSVARGIGSDEIPARHRLAPGPMDPQVAALPSPTCETRIWIG